MGNALQTVISYELKDNDSLDSSNKPYSNKTETRGGDVLELLVEYKRSCTRINILFVNCIFPPK